MADTSKHCHEPKRTPTQCQQTADEEFDFASVLLTPSELASRLQVKLSWVYSHADDIGAFRLGKYIRFSWPVVLGRLQAGHLN
jgi:hypothetical protein